MNNNTLERLEAGVRSVLAQKSLDDWLVGLVYDETDKHLTPLQRNGTRWMHFFHVGLTNRRHGRTSSAQPSNP